MFSIQVLTDVCTAYLGGSTGIPSQLAFVVYLVVRFIQVVVPILLIVWGMLDLGKAVMAQKEDEIKKGQQTFVKRLIAAVLVFFVVAITRLVIGLFAGTSDSKSSGKASDTDESTLLGCMNAIIECSSPDNCKS